MKIEHVLFLALLAGCGGSPRGLSLETPNRTPKASEYVDQVKKWTRTAHLRDMFDEALAVHATLRSPEFRAAFAERWIEMFRIGPTEAARVREQILAEGAGTYEFHVETASHAHELNNFTTAKSVWRVVLVDDRGREVTTKEVAASRERRELEYVLYPYVTQQHPNTADFVRGWRFRFPQTLPDGNPLVTPETSKLILRFAGPQGSVDLVWHLK
jgi:hypothetical protein